MVEAKDYAGESSDEWWLAAGKSQVLLTESLILRKLQMADAKPLARLANNINVAAMTGRLPHPYSLDDAEEFITRESHENARGCRFAITLADSAQVIGCCGLAPSQAGAGAGAWLLAGRTVLGQWLRHPGGPGAGRSCLQDHAT